MNSEDLDPHSNMRILKNNNQPIYTQTDVYILSLAISNFIHRYNELFKQQIEETIKAFNERSEKLKFTAENRKKIDADYWTRLKIIGKTYNHARKMVRDEFKEFKKTTEYLVKGAERLELIHKEYVQNCKKQLDAFENETKSGGYSRLLSIFQT